ncbi:MAG: hypothetical protein A2W98_08475 [Bacteroidetes bacterium GWF2_33_38]|nr:MAG: hypothetical protein A2W98_08475 [Bacteroidetes bacterium GWF2_33_38]OFY68039.1 MAG: hypothetical protein A2265_06765 [Bacteroidetes bacterium RIFOXYA12_FULL_33_9]OFY91294.1 MAG: hypothetical protein A2236_11110 [Bacteroidetes bacterium RIFOXYA2_FULL_33_7]
MSIERLAYSSEQAWQLRQLLQNNSKAGKPLDYEIYVDKLRIIPRTNNPEQFEEYEDFVTDDTKSISIIIYEGNSKRNNRYILVLKEEKLPEKPSLSGLEVNKIVGEHLEKQKKEWEYELLLKEKEEIKSDLEDAEEYIEQLENKIEELNNSKGKLSQQWGDLASVALEGIIRRNAHRLAKLPGASALAGMFAEENTTADAEEIKESETETTFERVNEDDKIIEKDRINFLKYMQEQLTKEEFEQMGSIISYLLKEKKAIVPTIVFLEEWEEENDDDEGNNLSKSTHNQQEFNKTDEFPATC